MFRCSFLCQISYLAGTWLKTIERGCLKFPLSYSASRALGLTSLETLRALVFKWSETICVDLRAEQNTEHEKQSSATARIHLIHNVLSGEKLEEKPLILRRSIILIKTLRHSRILFGSWLFLKSDRSHSRDLSYDNHRIALTSLLIESDGLL